MVGPDWCSAAKKAGREGQQHRLRDESGPAAGARLRLQVPLGLGTHVTQELPGLAKVLDDAGANCGGSGHGTQAPFEKLVRDVNRKSG
jgi:hypothetical protein